MLCTAYLSPMHLTCICEWSLKPCKLATLILSEFTIAVWLLLICYVIINCWQLAERLLLMKVTWFPNCLQTSCMFFHTYQRISTSFNIQAILVGRSKGFLSFLVLVSLSIWGWKLFTLSVCLCIQGKTNKANYRWSWSISLIQEWHLLCHPKAWSTKCL